MYCSDYYYLFDTSLVEGNRVLTMTTTSKLCTSIHYKTNSPTERFRKQYNICIHYTCTRHLQIVLFFFWRFILIHIMHTVVIYFVFFFTNVSPPRVRILYILYRYVKTYYTFIRICVYVPYNIVVHKLYVGTSMNPFKGVSVTRALDT